MKHKIKKLQVLLLFSVFCVLFPTPCFSYQEDEVVRLLLLQSEISTARKEELQRRAQGLNLNSQGNESELRARLLAYYDIEIPQEDVPETYEQNGIYVEIQRGDLLYSVTKPQLLILIQGNVEVFFSLDALDISGTIMSDSLAFDTESNLLVATGSLSFFQQTGQEFDILYGSLLSICLHTGKITLSDGYSSLTRENSEDELVQFFVGGETLYFEENQTIIQFDKGKISTVGDQEYFSIRADSLSLITGGDIFALNAVISLGRVPLVWIPFLYYPGKTFVFNPSFGFDSHRGIFFSTTTELYGSYPSLAVSDESSFTRLLGPTEESTMVRDGWNYEVEKGTTEVSPLESWAKKSSSYMALLFDAYERRGPFFGIDTVNNFSHKALIVALFGGVGLSSDSSQTSSVYTIPSVRYFARASITGKLPYATLSLDMPLYSDPKVLQDYGNRMTNFTLGSLFGDTNFPTTYSSDITSYTWNVTGTYSLPTSSFSPYIESLAITKLSGQAIWKAVRSNQGSGYELSSFKIPDFQATVRGTLFSWKGPTQNQQQTPKVSPDVVDSHISDEPLFSDDLVDIYRETPKPVVRSTPIAPSQASLTYRLQHQYSDDYRVVQEEATLQESYERISANFSFSGSLSPSLLTVLQKIDPIVTRSGNFQKTSIQSTITSTTDIRSPLLGLSYGLTYKFYSQNTVVEQGSISDESGGVLPWEKDSVSRHTISLSRNFSLPSMTITPSFTMRLPPLNMSLTPKVVCTVGNITTALSYDFDQQTGGGFSIGDSLVTLSHRLPPFWSFQGRFLFDGQTWDPKTISSSANFSLVSSGISIAQHVTYNFQTRMVNTFHTTLSTPWIGFSLYSGGPIDDLALEILDTKLTIKESSWYWWKQRISLHVGLSASYRHVFQNTFSSSFSFQLQSTFSIAEFLSLDISLKSVNNGFYRYQTFSDVLVDLVKSFDLFGTGRYETQFTMEQVEVSLIHHMSDWDLHCKYTGSVVLSDMEWRWKPSFSVYLQWKAIPEIKMDRKF